MRLVTKLLVFLLAFLLVGCTTAQPLAIEPEILPAFEEDAQEDTSLPDDCETTESGFMLTPNIRCQVIDVGFDYIVLDQKPDNYTEIISQAREIVKNWWGQDTFVEPIDILPVETYGQDAPRAFVRDGYLFVGFSEDDTLGNIVHEWIHLQNMSGLVYPDGTGREVMEMVVETITQELLGDLAGEPTDNYLFFASCPNLYAKKDIFIDSYKQQDEASTAYEKVFGKDAKDIVAKLDCYLYLDYVFQTDLERQIFYQSILGI